MSSSPPPSGTGAPRSVWSGLEWWHWALFLLPTVVTVVTTKVLIAWYRSQESGGGIPSLSGVGALLYGLSAGGLACVLAGIVLGMTMPLRNRAMACIGWTLLCALTTLPISYAVLAILDTMSGR